MFFRMRSFFVIVLLTVCWSLTGQAAGERVLRVAVLDNSPPMAYRDEHGELTGFSIGIIQAICEEMHAKCLLQVISLDQTLDVLANGEADIAAISLLDTPERRRRILFAKPYFRSVSLWFAKPGIVPGNPAARVAVVSGSAQERFALARHWPVHPVRSNVELLAPLRAGQANAAIVPMSSGLNLVKQPEMSALALSTTVMNEPELGGDASFGISPRRAELKEEIDAALERIKRNGAYDRINSRFLPFRIN